MLGRTVILGGTGFIGRSLTERLTEAGADVRCHGSRALDLRRRESVAELQRQLDPATTLLFASMLTPPAGATLDGLAENLAMIDSVARALEGATVRRCVFVSSDAVYGWILESVDEQAPPEPTGYYGVAKLAGERVLVTVADGRFPLLILRPVAVFGPGDTHNAYGPNRFARSVAAEGVVRLVGRGEELRDHLFIDDLARLVARVLETDATGILNLASGTARTFASIVETLRGIVPHDLSVVEVPRMVPLRHRSYDVSRLTALVPGFRFTPFEEALRATVAAAAGGGA